MELLPTDLMTEIFYKLPINTICQSKSVCKAWYSILTGPHFINNYSTHTPYHTVLIPKKPLYSCRLVQISDDRADHIQTRIDLKLPEDWPIPDPGSTQIRLQCSYKGFLCVSGVKRGLSSSFNTLMVGLCNPITQEFVALPQCEISLSWKAYVKYIFGHTSTHRFKILKIISRLQGESIVQIFTVGVDKEWRSLPSELGYQILPGVTFKGVHHWRPRSWDSGSIQTFDLGEEKLSSISCHRDMHFHSAQLQVISDRLCVLDYWESDGVFSTEITMWTMKEYGVAESWTKAVILRSWFPQNPAWDFEYLRPIAQLGSGGLVFAYLSHDAAKWGSYLTTCSADGSRFTETKISASESDWVNSDYSPTFSSFKDFI